jgi:hypothetical protein
MLNFTESLFYGVKFPISLCGGGVLFSRPQAIYDLKIMASEMMWIKTAGADRVKNCLLYAVIAADQKVAHSFVLNYMQIL